VQNNLDAEAIVIDLRGNTCGDVLTVARCLGLFLPGGTVMGIVHGRKGTDQPIKIPDRKEASYRGRVFLMIDEESASGAEMFAAAMQEAGRATLLGRTTAGSVLVGIITNFRPDSISA
jgi:carboxyl-terminal processing protease